MVVTRPGIRAWLGACVVAAAAAWAQGADRAVELLERQNVTWTTPGQSPSDSMPTGNGDIGLNVWTEPNGDLLFYIGKTDAWSENDPGAKALLKVGRVRVSLTPNVAGAAAGTDRPFKQTLRLRESEIVVTAGGPGAETEIRVWVDANRPVIRVEAKSDGPTTLTARLENYRTAPEGKISADVVLPAADNRVTWYHRNGPSSNPVLTGRMFGATMVGDGLTGVDDSTLRSAAAGTTHRLSVHVLTQPAGTVEAWSAALGRQVAATDTVPAARAVEEHRKWWADFWGRSHIFVAGDEAADKVTLGYALQRYVTACAGRGAFPIKFNGSIFNVDDPAFMIRNRQTNKDEPVAVNADYRAWGDGYWMQNTRPMYWPRLPAGDFDLMKPFFRMYQDMLPVNAANVKQQYGHDGAFIYEFSHFWGGVSKSDPAAPGGYMAHYFVSIFELVAVMADYYEYTGDEAFARDSLVPVAKAAFTFYDQHFNRDAQGKLLIEPVNSLESFWKVKNPTPDLAALRFLLPKMIALPEPLVDEATRGQWRRLLSEVPELPVGEKGQVAAKGLRSEFGTRLDLPPKPVILPYSGEQTTKRLNWENPELYAVYPYRLFGVGKPDLELARDTYHRRDIRRSSCWHQDGIHAAYLGLADEAKLT